MAIDKIPDLKKYQKIISAHKNNKLIFFIGAGVSSLWGCKRWQEMAVSLINASEKTHFEKNV